LNAAASSAIGVPMKTLSKNAKAATTVLMRPERAALLEVGGAAIPPCIGRRAEALEPLVPVDDTRRRRLRSFRRRR